VLLLSIIGTGIGFLILGTGDDTSGCFFIGRILDGITGGNISTAQAYIADRHRPKRTVRKVWD
jgi:DHA1 family tetracycline resistance protein-like MFS transporter